MIEMLKQLDLDIFFWINGHHSPIFDKVEWWMTQIWFWIPFFLLVLFFLIRHYHRRIWGVVLCLALCMYLTDRGSVFIKNMVQRPRPTHAVEIQDKVHVHLYANGNEYRGGHSGFPSSHAANDFGWVVLLIYFFKPVTKHAWWIFPLWALLSCYTRVYLGVHYPSDIVCGTLLGLCCGFLVLGGYMLNTRKKKDGCRNTKHNGQDKI